MRDERIARNLGWLSKELGIVSDTEIVRYCITQTYKKLNKNRG